MTVEESRAIYDLGPEAVIVLVQPASGGLAIIAQQQDTRHPDGEGVREDLRLLPRPPEADWG